MKLHSPSLLSVVHIIYSVHIIRIFMQESSSIYLLEARAASPADRGGVSETGGGRDPTCTGRTEEVLQQSRVQPMEGSVQASVSEKV